MAVLNSSSQGFQKDVLESGGVVFVDFYAPWCGPCQAASSIIEDLAGENNQTKFVKINVDESPELVSKYSIFSIPTFVIFKGGKPVSQFSGAPSKEALAEEIKKAASF